MSKTKTRQKVTKVVATCEKAGYSMTYHMILNLLEIFFVIRSILNIISSFSNASTLYRTIDQLFYILTGILALIGILKHDSHKGVISLYLFMAVDLVLNYVVAFAAWSSNTQVPGLTSRLVIWTICTVAWFMATMLYYRKRWEYLEA